MGRIIQRDKSVVVACDVPLEKFEDIVRDTANIDGIGAYKVGPALTGRPGYDKVVEIARKYTNKPLIFDGQKWGTDIPDTAKPILTPLKESGIDAVILFPLAGLRTQIAWTSTAQELGLGVIVGGEMTHEAYLESNGGYILDSAPGRIYATSALDPFYIENFIVPGNKPESVECYRQLLGDKAIFFAPGFITQGGDISETGKVAGQYWHAIVGRAITGAKDYAKAAQGLTSKL